MIFAKGKVRHQGLMTTYTDLTSLVSTLKTERFSGTIEIEFPKAEGILFLSAGEVVNGEANLEAGSKRLIGQEAVQRLLSFSNQKDGVLNIYQLAPEHVAILASHLQHEIVFKGLSTEFTRLDRLLLKLKEEKHTGFIEVFGKDQAPQGVLFLQEGEPAEMFTFSESGQSVFGRKSVPGFVEGVAKEGAILNVYRTDQKKPGPPPVQLIPPSPVEKGDGLKEVVQIFENILAKVERLVDEASEKETFRRFFKRSLIEKSERYPFLDPFGGEFDYRDGMIQFAGGVRDRDFTQGLGECLQATLFRIGEELPKSKMLPSRLRAEIESSLEPYRATIMRLGLASFISSFA